MIKQSSYNPVHCLQHFCTYRYLILPRCLTSFYLLYCIACLTGSAVIGSAEIAVLFLHVQGCPASLKVPALVCFTALSQIIHSISLFSFSLKIFITLLSLPLVRYLAMVPNSFLHKKMKQQQSAKSDQ